MIPTEMRAAYWSGAGRPVTAVSMPTPFPEAPSDVLIRMRSAMFGAALVRAVTAGHPKLRPPQVLGSVLAGEIAATGSAISHLHVGQLVTVDPHPPCGQCDHCTDGLAALCSDGATLEPGAHAEYVRVREPASSHIRSLDGSVSPESAMLTEIVACAEDAIEEARIGSDQTVLVLGCGPVALIIAQLARLRGPAEVLCSVNHADRVPLVREVGATPIPTDQLHSLVAERTGGRGPHVVIEAVGRSETYATALATVRSGGTVVGFGGCPPESSLAVDPNALHYRRIHFHGAYHYRPGIFDRAADLIQEKRIELDPLITHRIPLARISEAVDIATSPECLIPAIVP